MSPLVLPLEELSQLRVRATATHTWGGGEGGREGEMEERRVKYGNYYSVTTT